MGGLSVNVDHMLADCPKLDVLVVPGGWGSRREMHNTALIAWIADQAGRVQILSSVCTGALLLAQAGALDGHRVTTHWAALELLAQHCPRATVVDNQRVVQETRLLTSAGIAAGIDMSLHIVRRYWGEPVARNTARYMEYPYPDCNRREPVSASSVA